MCFHGLFVFVRVLQIDVANYYNNVFTDCMLQGVKFRVELYVFQVCSLQADILSESFFTLSKLGFSLSTIAFSLVPCFRAAGLVV